MTTPQPVDPLVEFTHKIRDEASVVIERLHLKYLLVLFIVLATVIIGASKAYGWYEGRLAKLEAEKPALQQKLDAATKAGDVWREQALALARTRAVDTVLTLRYIAGVQPFTAPYPVRAADGSVSIVPMPAVLATSFDSLGRFCAKERQDCNAHVASLLGVIQSDSARINALSDLLENTATQNRLQKRADVFTKAKWGVGGVGVGALIVTILAFIHH